MATQIKRQKSNALQLIVFILGCFSTCTAESDSLFQKHNIVLGRKLTAYDEQRYFLDSKTMRVRSLTDPNSIHRLYTLEIAGKKIDFNTDSERRIVKISTMDQGLIGPKGLKIGMPLKNTLKYCEEYHYNFTYLGFFCVIKPDSLVVFGESDSLRDATSSQGYVKDGVFTVEKPAPARIKVTASKYENMRIEYFVWQPYAHALTYATQIDIAK